jgi:hypothetical protein
MSYLAACGKRGAPRAEAITAAPAAPPASVPAAPASEPEPAGPPMIAPSALLRPVFNTTEGEIPAGSAFMVRVGDHKLLLTAHHLFGPMGGMSRDIPPDELPKVFKSVRAKSSADPALSVESSQLVAIADAHAFEKGDFSHDLAAFVLEPPANATVLELASAMPAVGARVYLLAEPIGKPVGLFSGRVTFLGPTALAYTLDDTTMQLAGSSGAPVLDAHGRVVGTNLAGGLMGTVYRGAGNPITSIRERLTSALSAPNAK